jgi:hypothetical protein
VREAARAPPPVIPTVAEPPFGVCQHEERGREALPLKVRPRGFLFVEHRHLGDVIEPEKRPSTRASHVQRDRDHDTAQPRAESTRLVEVPKPPVSSKEGFLCRILGKAGVAQDALGNGIRHRLAPSHQAAKRLEIAALRTNDQLPQEVRVLHVSLLIGEDTPVVEL